MTSQSTKNSKQQAHNKTPTTNYSALQRKEIFNRENASTKAYQKKLCINKLIV